MSVMKLTQDEIPKLRCPGDKRAIQVCDAQHKGLLLELRRADPEHPTWYYRYKDPAGQTRYVKLGLSPDVSLAEVRERAKDLRAEIRLGADPRGAEEAGKAIPTFAAFMDGQYFPHARTHKITADKDEEYYRLRLQEAFSRQRLDAITRRDIQRFHSQLHEEGLAPATCNHYLKLIKRALNLAIAWEIIPGPNQAVGIQQFRELNLVENYMDEIELGKLLAVLRTDPNRTVCAIVLFLLSTGARLNEALRAEWQHVDKERRVWRIPATNSKSGKVRAVPLNDAALEVLNRQDTAEQYAHVLDRPAVHDDPEGLG